MKQLVTFTLIFMANLFAINVCAAGTSTGTVISNCATANYSDGPVYYQDIPAANGSGLTHNCAGIISAIDEVSFATDGVYFSYIPVGAGGFDSNIRFIQITTTDFFNKVTIDVSDYQGIQPDFNFTYQIRLN